MHMVLCSTPLWIRSLGEVCLKFRSGVPKLWGSSEEPLTLLLRPLLEIELKEEAELQSEPKSLLSLNSAQLSVPPSDSTFACLLLPVLALRWGVFRALCSVLKNTHTDKCSHRRSVCYLLVQHLCHYCHLSLVTRHSGGGGVGGGGGGFAHPWGIPTL